jgi:hypothetical protein
MPTHPLPDPKPLSLHQIAGIVDQLTPRQREALTSTTTRGNVDGAIHAHSRATIGALVNAGLAHTPYGNTALLTPDGAAVRRALGTPPIPAPRPLPSAEELVKAAYRRGLRDALVRVAKSLPGLDPALFNPERTLAYLAVELGVPWKEES